MHQIENELYVHLLPYTASVVKNLSDACNILLSYTVTLDEQAKNYKIEVTDISLKIKNGRKKNIPEAHKLRMDLQVGESTKSTDVHNRCNFNARNITNVQCHGKPTRTSQEATRSITIHHRKSYQYNFCGPKVSSTGV